MPAIRIATIQILFAIFVYQVCSESTEPTSISSSSELPLVNSITTEATIAETTLVVNTTISAIENNSTANESTTTSSTTTSPTVSPPPITEGTGPSIFCPCDHALNTCEVNCCCDPDCPDKLLKTFWPCADEDAFRKYHAARDSRRCYRRDFLYRNNTIYKSEISQNGLFCIVNQNLKKEQQFPTAKINLARISKYTKSKFSWRMINVDKKFPQQPAKTQYKYGHQIQIAKRIPNATDSDSENYVRIGMTLPAPAFGPKCIAKSPVNFLKNEEFLCPFQILNLTDQCQTSEMLDAATFMSRDSFIISNPSAGISEPNLVNLTYSFCPTKNSGCYETKILKSPFFNFETSSCDNVLTQMDLIFKHAGTEGLKHVTAEIHYANFTLAGTKTILQKFSVSFAWDDPAEDHIHLHPPRLISGNPGYIIGKPVIVGSKVKVNDLDQNKGQVPKVVLDSIQHGELIIRPPTKPLTLLNPPKCGQGPRRPLTFGFDLKVTCALGYSDLGTCQNLTSAVETTLFGMSAEKFTSRYVSALGDPHLMRSEDWVHWTTSENPFKSLIGSPKSIDSGCHGLVTSMHLHFLYARVGSVHFPQLKILAAFIQYGSTISIPPRNANSSESAITITTTAEFTDVTPPPVTPIPKWPIISIRLPQDFFYPFSIATSAGSKSLCSLSVVVIFKVTQLF